MWNIDVKFVSDEANSELYIPTAHEIAVALHTYNAFRLAWN